MYVHSVDDDLLVLDMSVELDEVLPRNDPDDGVCVIHHHDMAKTQRPKLVEHPRVGHVLGDGVWCRVHIGS